MNMNDNVKFISELERLLKQKQNDYGHFDHTSYVMVEIMEKYLSIHNNQPVKIPLKFFGLVMILLKTWRIMQSKDYKKDHFGIRIENLIFVKMYLFDAARHKKLMFNKIVASQQ